MSKRRPAKQQPATNCGVCTAPVHAAYVCARCMDRYHGHLARVPDAAKELRIEHMRAATKGMALISKGTAETPMPWVEAASQALEQLRTALVTACRALVLDQELPEDRIGAMCAWLAQREDSIPLRPEGPDIVAELDAAMARAMRVCDTPPERVLRGRCACGDELRSRPGAGVVTCRCGLTYRGDQLDETLQAHIVDHLAPWADLEGYGHGALRIPRGTLDSWRRRGKLRPVSRTINGEPLYRVGDMLNLDEQRRGA